MKFNSQKEIYQKVNEDFWVVWFMDEKKYSSVFSKFLHSF